MDNKYYETTIFKYDEKGRIILVANTSVDLPNFEFKYEEYGDINRVIINDDIFVYGDSGLNILDELKYIMRNPRANEFKYDKIIILFIKNILMIKKNICIMTKMIILSKNKYITKIN